MSEQKRNGARYTKKSMTINEIVVNLLERRLNKNGWQFQLISTLTPGVIRIQMAPDEDDDPGWRKCFSAKSLDEALENAETFINTNNAHEYGSNLQFADGDEGF